VYVHINSTAFNADVKGQYLFDTRPNNAMEYIAKAIWVHLRVLSEKEGLWKKASKVGVVDIAQEQ